MPQYVGGKLARLAGVCFCGAFALGALLAQESAVAISPRASYRSSPTSSRSSFKVDLKVILVPVTVTDSLDRPITDLPWSSFKIYEDNVEQTVASFQKEDGPVSMGFIVDTSGSMRERMGPSIAAVRQLLELTIPMDEYFLMRFSDQPDRITEFTRHPEEIVGVLPSLHPGGSTALNDAIYLGVQAMKRGTNVREAVVVLSDGGDNSSRYSDSEVRNLVQESDVRVYSIGLFTRPSLLAKLASDSGGRAFWARDMGDLPRIVEQLSRVFRNEYVLGYIPRNGTSDGKYRQIRVEVTANGRRDPLHISWRRGYRPPE